MSGEPKGHPLGWVVVGFLLATAFYLTLLCGLVIFSEPKRPPQDKVWADVPDMQINAYDVETNRAFFFNRLPDNDGNRVYMLCTIGGKK